MELQPTQVQLAATARLREDLRIVFGERGYVVMVEDVDPGLAAVAAMAIKVADEECISGSVPLDQDPKRAKVVMIFPRAA